MVQTEDFRYVIRGEEERHAEGFGRKGASAQLLEMAMHYAVHELLQRRVFRTAGERMGRMALAEKVVRPRNYRTGYRYAGS